MSTKKEKEAVDERNELSDEELEEAAGGVKSVSSVSSLYEEISFKPKKTGRDQSFDDWDKIKSL